MQLYLALFNCTVCRANVTVRNTDSLTCAAEVLRHAFFHLDMPIE